MDARNKEAKIVIIGCGIGGAATAVALQNEGINAEIYEQASAITEVGAGIGMRPPTINFFKKWGIYEDIERKSSLSNFMEILLGNGDVLVKENWPLLTNGDEEGGWARLIHRADLIDILLSHIPPELIHLKHRCDSIITHENYAEVHFENGKSIEADLVIAADGIRSLVRSNFFSKVDPVYSGTHAYRAILDEKDSFGLFEDNTFKVFIDGDVNVYVMPLHHRNQISFDVTVPSEKVAWRPDIDKTEMLSYLKNFDSKIQAIAANIENYTCRAVYDIEPVESWNSNCVTLLGDSAHAMLHHQGQGANMAIQDGGVLAESLSDSKTIPEALKKYYARRKPVTDKYQELSRQQYNQEATTAFPEKEAFEQK